MDSHDVKRTRSMTPGESEEPTRVNRKKKPSRKLLTVLAICLFLLSITVTILYFTSTVSGEKEVYYRADFSGDTGEWQGDDSSWKEQLSGHDGLLALTKKEMMAPYSMSTLPSEKVKTDSFAFHTSFYLTEFTGQATTLSTLVFPAASLSIVVNDEGKLGIARDLFKKPIYSDHPGADIKLKTWENLQVYVDGKEGRIRVYQGGLEVLDEKWEDPTYPLQEVWLGSIWLEGSGNYGAASQLAFDQVEIGNQAILTQPTFFGFVAGLGLDLLNNLRNFIVSVLP